MSKRRVGKNAVVSPHLKTLRKIQKHASSFDTNNLCKLANEDPELAASLQKFLQALEQSPNYVEPKEQKKEKTRAEEIEEFLNTLYNLTANDVRPEFKRPKNMPMFEDIPIHREHHEVAHYRAVSIEGNADLAKAFAKCKRGQLYFCLILHADQNEIHYASNEELAQKAFPRHKKFDRREISRCIGLYKLLKMAPSAFVLLKDGYPLSWLENCATAITKRLDANKELREKLIQHKSFYRWTCAPKQEDEQELSENDWFDTLNEKDWEEQVIQAENVRTKLLNTSIKRLVSATATSKNSGSTTPMDTDSSE